MRTAVHKPRTAMHKYHAQPTTVDGIRFDSKREAHRYGELKLLLRAHEIRDLKIHQEFPLAVTDETGELRVIGAYFADFTYIDRRGKPVVEDVKGVQTPLYRWKKKHVACQYGIDIQEIR
jgi:hypothetical protein